MANASLTFEELKNTVIDRGLCTVCGTCIGICPAKCLDWEFEDEEPEPVLVGKCTSCGLCIKACPGADIPLPELEKFCFGKTRDNRPDDYGVFTFSGRGYALDDEVHKAGSGGGLGTALLVYGLEKGLIDCALVAGYSQEKPWRTEAKIATTREELIESAQSKYAAVGVNAVLGEAVKRGYKNIAILGCPCHIEAIRKMEYQKLAPNITKRIKILIGLICGTQFHFEGTRHIITELAHVEDLERVTRLHYRGRGKGDEWRSKFAIELDNGEMKQMPRSEALAKRLSYFSRERCDMCADWSAELADVVLADYWGPHGAMTDEYTYSSILLRTPRGAEWLKGAQDTNYVTIDEITTDYLLDCPGFERKKHGAVHRLQRRKRYGWPTPDFHCELSHAPFPGPFTSGMKTV